ncbi:MAG: hypothetical protein U0Z26_15800 [Anaerolineales bacterium]
MRIPLVFQLEEQARRLNKSGWQDYLDGLNRAEKIGYVFDQIEILPLTEITAK